MIFLLVCSSDIGLIVQGRHINISTSVGVEPRNAACMPSTATFDVINHNTPARHPQKKDTQVAYI